MKKVIFTFAIALAVALTACGEEPKLYEKGERIGDTPTSEYITVGDANKVDSLSYCYGFIQSYSLPRQLQGIKVNWTILKEGMDDAFYGHLKENKRHEKAVENLSTFFNQEYYSRLQAKQQEMSADTTQVFDINKIDIFKDEKERQTISYDLGYDMGYNIANSRMHFEIKSLFKGMDEGLKENMDLKMQYIQNYMQRAFNELLPAQNLERSQAWLAEVEASVEGIQKSESGLLYLIEKEGDKSVTPNPTDMISMNLKWTLIDGTEMMPTEEGQPTKQTLNSMFPGWQEGMALIGKGGKITLWIPAELAFGDRGYSMCQPNEAHKIEVEIIDFYENSPEANLARSEKWLAEVEATVEGVQKTESGLLYLIEREGDKNLMPAAEDSVVAHYEGTIWDGTKFDSSYDRGEPATFPLNRVIPGWTEGLQLIGKGGKITLWIPAELGYGQRNMGTIQANDALKFVVELEDVIKAEPAVEAAK